MGFLVGDQSISSRYVGNFLFERYVGGSLDWPIQISLPTMGSFWTEEGGYYIGQITNEGNNYALVLGPRNLGEQNGYWFGGAGNLIGTPNLTDGYGNTQKLKTEESTSVFKWASELIINGKNDWYIPARDEWDVIGSNKASLSADQYFAWDYYWTSNEFNSFNAWEYVVSTGNHENYWKDSSSASRVIRRVSI